MIIEVQTTQNVTIDYETASIGSRILAYLLDIIAITIWGFGCFGLLILFPEYLLNYIFGEISIFFIILLGLPIIFYDFLFEVFNHGQSIGKMIMKIRVVKTDGTTPSDGAYLIRWLFRLIDFAFTRGLLAVIMIASTQKSQRLGDMLAGTTVISLKVSSRNRELSITDLDFKENYKIAYNDILDKLSDRDIQTIRSIIDDERMKNNIYFNKRLADKVKTITGYVYEGADNEFLQKIVSDYDYLAVQE